MPGLIQSNIAEKDAGLVLTILSSKSRTLSVVYLERKFKAPQGTQIPFQLLHMAMWVGLLRLDPNEVLLDTSAVRYTT